MRCVAKLVPITDGKVILEGLAVSDADRRIVARGVAVEMRMGHRSDWRRRRQHVLGRGEVLARRQKRERGEQV